MAQIRLEDSIDERVTIAVLCEKMEALRIAFDHHATDYSGRVQALDSRIQVMERQVDSMLSIINNLNQKLLEFIAGNSDALRKSETEIYQLKTRVEALEELQKSYKIKETVKQNLSNRTVSQVNFVSVLFAILIAVLAIIWHYWA